MPWVKLSDQRAMHRKLRKAGFAARGLDEAAICQIAADLSDGHISRDTVETLAMAHGEKRWQRLADILVEVGRWEPNGDGWWVHDYLEYNPSRAQWEEELAKKRSAGAKGGRARAANAQALAKAPATASARAPAQADFKQTLKPTRPDPKSSSSSLRDDPPQPTPTVAAAAADNLVEEALRAIAERRLALRTDVKNPGGFIVGTIKGLRLDHRDKLASLDLTQFATPESLAQSLEPPRVEPANLTQIAARTLMERSIKPACPGCDGTGWTDATVNGVTKCLQCHGTGIAA